MDPRRFLAQAQRLAAGGEPEDRRSALSRAYYAVYHAAVELLHAAGAEPDTGHSGHALVRRALRGPRVDRLTAVSRQLERLHNLRVKADYWLHDPQPENAAVVAQ